MKVEISKEEKLNLESFSSSKSLISYSRTGLFSMEKVIIDQYAPFPSKILDIGCGLGRTTVPLYDMGYDVIGIDLSEAMILKAKQDFPKINFQIADACDLKFKDCSFDLIIFSYNGIDYIYPEHKRMLALKEMRRVLKPGGILIFTSHNIWAVICHHRSYYRWLRLFIRNNPFRSKHSIKQETRFGRYLTDRTKYGDLITYFIDPISQKKQISEIGFQILEIRGHFKKILKYFEPWPYYIVKRNN